MVEENSNVINQESLIEDDDDDDDELEEEGEENIDNTSMNLWLMDIKTEVMQTLEIEDHGDRDNIMYNPAFSKYFLDLCKLLPLWSAICCKHFKGAPLITSSGNVESFFNDLKRCHQDIIPCSADKFVESDLDFINFCFYLFLTNGYKPYWRRQKEYNFLHTYKDENC